MVALIFGTRGLISGANAIYGVMDRDVSYQRYCSDQLKMYDFWGARCMIFWAMAPGLFFEVVFLLLNGSAHFWDERSNFRGECQIWWDG
ncbi:hypothetical protein [Sphingobacterium zeae]|uniref:hypothetical protein n=1 Tax=Sphingobacterium zeae TaxID=1776859 RepID=UPI003607FCC6